MNKSRKYPVRYCGGPLYYLNKQAIKCFSNENIKIKVALNMIVKNEQDNICRTLESVKEFCDLFVILDTGSEDDTIKTIIDYCEKINKPNNKETFANNNTNTILLLIIIIIVIILLVCNNKNYY